MHIVLSTPSVDTYSRASSHIRNYMYFGRIEIWEIPLNVNKHCGQI